jgi:hypothetical protein
MQKKEQCLDLDFIEKQLLKLVLNIEKTKKRTLPESFLKNI